MSDVNMELTSLMLMVDDCFFQGERKGEGVGRRKGEREGKRKREKEGRKESRKEGRKEKGEGGRKEGREGSEASSSTLGQPLPVNLNRSAAMSHLL